MKNIIKILSISGLISISQISHADTIVDNYATGDTLTATMMNSIKSAVNDNDSRVASLESTIATMQSTITSLQNSANNNASRVTSLENTITTMQGTITTLQNTISTLQADLATIQSNTVLDLDGRLIFLVDSNGYATAQFTGVNVQVVNGVNHGTLNGLGNLIVGYNEATTVLQAQEVCSDGAFADQTSCETAGNTWGRNHKTGSHNLVAGRWNSYSSHSGAVFGHNNVVNRPGASVTGGYGNAATGLRATVTGGYTNVASGDRSAILGGFAGRAEGLLSTLSGGEQNVSSGQYSNIVSGFNNRITGGRWNSILGGSGRTITSGDNITVPAIP